MNIDEQQIANHLREKGLRVEEFTKEEKRKSKTPEFRVFKGDKLAFFCEVKSISYDDWLDEQLEAAPPGTIVGGARKDWRYNSISKKIHEAIKQFDAVNPKLEYLNVLAFVNHDTECNDYDLVAVTTGNFLAEGGVRDQIYTKFSEGRIKDEKSRIHLYIWKNEFGEVHIWNDKGPPDKFKGVRYGFNTFEKKHINNLCSYLDIDPESVKNILR